MRAKDILLKQFIIDNQSIKNKHTQIIKKPYVLLSIEADQTIKASPRRFKQLRSRSQNTRHSKNSILSYKNFISIQNSPRLGTLSRHKNLKTEHKKNSSKITPVYHSIQNYKSNLLLTTKNISKIRKNFKDYLLFIRALPTEAYQISANFQQLRKRSRRLYLKTQKQLFEFILNLYESIYGVIKTFIQHLGNQKKDNSKIVFNCCQMYFRCFQKIRIDIIFLIYYPNNLHAKLWPFFIYERLFLFNLSSISFDNGLQKLTKGQIETLKLIMQLNYEIYKGLLEPIKQEEQVLNSINQTFRTLKAVGQAEKKLLIIQKQLRKIHFYSQAITEIEQKFKFLLNNQQQKSLEQLNRSQMKLCWEYLKIPPTPYLPLKISQKKYTLVVQLDNTLIFYDKKTKILKYRPYLELFLHRAYQYLQIVAFTTAQHNYAEVLIGQIQRENRFFSYILSQRHLSYSFSGQLIKDVSRLGRELKSIVLIDHLPSIYKSYSLNGIGISSWQGDKSDKQLKKILLILQDLIRSDVDDTREFLRHIPRYNVRNHNQQTDK